MEEWANQFRRFFTFVFSLPFCCQLICAALDATFCIGHRHLKKKYIIQKIIAFCALFLSRLLLSAVFSSFSLRDTYTPYLIVASIIVPGAVYILLFEHSNYSHKLIKLLLFISSAYVVTEIGHQVNNLSLSLSPALRSFVRCLPNFLMMVTGLIVGINNINRYLDIPSSSLILSLFVFLSLFVITLRTSKINSSASSDGSFGNLSGESKYLSLTIILILIFFLATDLGIYIVLYLNQKKQEDRLVRQAKVKLNESAYTRLKLNEESIERTTIARHDLKNHYAYIANLIKEKQYGKALDYASSVNEETFGNFHIVDCGNQVVSSIRNLELSKSRIRNIPLQYLLAVPQVLPFKETLLCSLITNLVDNAFENYHPTGKDDPVDVKRGMTDGYLRITVSNPTDREEVNLKTKKKNSGHGYGIKIVKSIVESCNGHICFKISDHRFIADARLDLETNGTKE